MVVFCFVTVTLTTPTRRCFYLAHQHSQLLIDPTGNTTSERSGVPQLPFVAVVYKKMRVASITYGMGPFKRNTDAVTLVLHNFIGRSCLELTTLLRPENR